MKNNSQREIAKSRTPRVHIEYDVEVNGERQAVELPFVIGVLSNLGRNNNVDDKPPIQDRSFVEIDAESFNKVLNEISPMLNLRVKNHLGSNDLLQTSLTFREMSDFRPDKLAEQVPALAHLLEARKKLSMLLTYMDGKAGAETLIKNILGNHALLESLGGAHDADH